MKCRKQPPYKIPEKIANVWEVIIDKETFAQIVQARNKSKKTYSWVVRYCLFKLIRNPKRMKKLTAMEFHSGPIPTRATGHRLQLCLYGDDEKLVRILATQAGVTVSRLLRTAIKTFLCTFCVKFIQKTLCYIKNFKRLYFEFCRSKERKQMLQFENESYPLRDYFCVSR